MVINVPPELGHYLPLLGTSIDTSAMTESAVTNLDEWLDKQREDALPRVPQQDREIFQAMIGEITWQLGVALVEGDCLPDPPEIVLTAMETDLESAPLTSTTSAPKPTPPPAALPLPTSMPAHSPVSTPTSAPGTKPPGPKRANPHAGKVKFLRKDFGTQVHDQFHFAPTDQKKIHGVWQGNLSQIKAWVGMALDSIHTDDDHLIASKKGDKAGQFNYLVSMGTPVGYVSGSSYPKPLPATHVIVFLTKNGVTVSAFPGDPSAF